MAYNVRNKTGRIHAHLPFPYPSVSTRKFMVKKYRPHWEDITPVINFKLLNSLVLENYLWYIN